MKNILIILLSFLVLHFQASQAVCDSNVPSIFPMPKQYFKDKSPRKIGIEIKNTQSKPVKFEIGLSTVFGKTIIKPALQQVVVSANSTKYYTLERIFKKDIQNIQARGAKEKWKNFWLLIIEPKNSNEKFQITLVGRTNDRFNLTQPTVLASSSEVAFNPVSGGEAFFQMQREYKIRLYNIGSEKKKKTVTTYDVYNVNADGMERKVYSVGLKPGQFKIYEFEKRPSEKLNYLIRKSEESSRYIAVLQSDEQKYTFQPEAIKQIMSSESLYCSK